MRHSKGTKVTKEEYYNIRYSLNYAEIEGKTQAEIAHNYRRSPYTIKKIKDSKSYNDYLMMVGRQEVDVEGYRNFKGRMYPEFDKNKHTVPFNCSVNGYDDEDDMSEVEWNVGGTDVDNIKGLLADLHKKADQILKRLDQIDDNTKWVRD